MVTSKAGYVKADFMRLFVIILLSLVSSHLVYAEQAYQDHAVIYATAESFLQNDLKHEEASKVTLGTLDSRLRLHDCGSSLEAFYPAGGKKSGNITVGVRCKGKRPWSINLPATIDVYKKVLVSNRLLSRGESVLPGDLVLEQRNIARMPYGYLVDIDSNLGLDVKRRIMPGTVITPSMLKRPQLVKRGQKVTIVARAGSANVRMMGKALGSGAAGDLIQVQNDSSRRKIQGVISQAGEVLVK